MTVTRTSIGSGPINEFTFSPCGQYLALVSQDGWMAPSARNYFGGLFCVCW